MKRFFLTFAALALCLAATPDVEAGCRGGRCGRGGGLLSRLRERRQEHGGRFHLFQRFGNRGCQSCDASDQEQAPELIRDPAELLPETRFASSDQE